MADDEKIITISFQPHGRKVHVPKGTTILDAAVRAGVGVEGPCGGQGTCGKCKVKVLPFAGEDIPPRNALEEEALNEEDVAEGLRLACQVPLEFDCAIEVPKDSRIYKHLVLMTGLESATIAVPNVAVSTETIGDETETTVSIGERVVEKKKGEHLEAYGVAIDLGTTTVVCHLVDLREGVVLSSTVDLNPQVARGDDVISRIQHAKSPEGGDWLTAQARGVVNKLINEACEKADVDNRDLYELVFAGNTCMHHLFFGLDVSSLGKAPYIPSHTGSLTVSAKELGIDINPKGQIYSLPVLAGFLGADAAAVAVTAALDCYEGTRLAIDIGTNGEILLCTKGKIYGCSSPAGPAFEGAQISCGMRAYTGAISYMRIEDGKVRYSVVGSSKPKGITGSGLVDAAAQLVKEGLLDTNGRFTKEKKGKLIRKGPDGPELLVAKKKDTLHGKDIVITQKDIRQLQLAKAAIASGISVLLEVAGLSPGDIDDIYVAGAFGNYIDRGSAMAIGLLPEIDPKRIVSIGNAAAIGAKRALVSMVERARAGTIEKKMNYIELAGRKDFQDIFMSHISF